jgi:hypothetical protein
MADLKRYIRSILYSIYKTDADKADLQLYPHLIILGEIY